METSNMIRLPDVAKMLGVSESWCYQLTHKGIIPHYKPNNKTLYFDRAEIENYMRKGRVLGKEEREAQAVKNGLKAKV